MVITTLPRARRVVVAVIAALAALGIGSAASSASASTLGMPLLEPRLPRSLPLIDDAQAVQDLNEQREANGISEQARLPELLSSDTRPVAARSDTGSVAAAHHTKDATLRIVVRSLPGRLSAKIIVTGPHHVHKRVSRSVTLKLPAGAYSLSAAPVKSSSGSYYATTPRSRVVLRAGKATSSTVVYATLVPKSTVVVPADATSSLTGDPSGPRVLTITGSAARAVRVGDSLSSGVTSAAPYGYLVKVTKVAHKSGSSATFDVENTTLLVALPTGEINAEQALEPTAEAASANDLRRVNLTLGRGLHGSSRAHAAGFTINTENLECESSAGVHLGRPTLTFSPSMAVHASWGFLKLDSASISITAAESLSFGATADAGAHCSTSSPGIGLFPHPITLGTFDIQVGPVPVTVTPKLQLYLSGQATIEAKATFSLEQGASVTVGASYEHGSFHPISSLSQHFTPTFTAEGDASGEIALTPTVDTLVYDVAGPSFDVGAVAKLNANVKASPWWTLQGCLQAGLGFVISPLDLNWSDPHLIQLCKTLLSASSPPPAGAIAASSPPTNTSLPAIADEQSNAPPKVGDMLHASPGSWTGSPTSYAYQWQDCKPAGTCSLILNSSSSSYVVSPQDTGSNLRVLVTAFNGTGASLPAASSETGAPKSSIIMNTLALNDGTGCSIHLEGLLECWGLDDSGQLGNEEPKNGTTEECYGNSQWCERAPVLVAGITDAVDITTGGETSCAVLLGGSIDCWGQGEWGEFGNGEWYESGLPVAVPGITNATEVSAGGYVCALLATGSIDCWGGASEGSLGNGTVEGTETCRGGDGCSTVPVPVSNITTATSISVGYGNACAVLVNGTIECWGADIYGELGNGTTGYGSNVPTPVAGITNAIGVSMSADNACAVLRTGEVMCWGKNTYGNLGDGTTENSEVPMRVTGITDATAVSVSRVGACAVLSTGSVDCWGSDELGALGVGSETGLRQCYNESCSITPLPVVGISDASEISISEYTGCVRLPAEAVDCWGDNQYGELGEGKTEVSSEVPVPVRGFE